MINWKVRFNKENRAFILRFLGALVLPILTYYQMNYEDLNTWLAVIELLIKFISNPFLVALTIINALLLIPDPTTPGIADSKRALHYIAPGKVAAYTQRNFEGENDDENNKG